MKSTSPVHDEQWTLSQPGNWDVYKLDLNGDTDFGDADELNDDQTFNTVNELIARDTDDNGTDNYDLVYDDAGNLTDDDKDYEFIYDAFGRLVEVQNQSQQTVAEYTYNGLGYRTGWHYDVDGDGTVETNASSTPDDPWFQFVYDTRWRITATYRASHYDTWTIDSSPKEQFVYHNAGLDGTGGSSYIDSVILRDRDANTDWEDQADGTLESRGYYCQSWRADVVALVNSSGSLRSQVRYDPYGVPFGIAKTDLDADGDVDASDASLYTTLYNGGSGTHPYADWNWDGATDASDPAAYTASKSVDSGLGRGVGGYGYSNAAAGANRKLYAGYEVDPVLTGSEGWEGVYHVRHRAYLSQLGRWTRRDPLGYVDGPNKYNYADGRPRVQADPTGLTRTCYQFDWEQTKCLVPLLTWDGPNNVPGCTGSLLRAEIEHACTLDLRLSLKDEEYLDPECNRDCQNGNWDYGRCDWFEWDEYSWKMAPIHYNQLAVENPNGKPAYCVFTNVTASIEHHIRDRLGACRCHFFPWTNVI